MRIACWIPKATDTLTASNAGQRIRAVRWSEPCSTALQQGMTVLPARDVGGYPLTHLHYEIRNQSHKSKPGWY